MNVDHDIDFTSLLFFFRLRLLIEMIRVFMCLCSCVGVESLCNMVYTIELDIYDSIVVKY